MDRCNDTEFLIFIFLYPHGVKRIYLLKSWSTYFTNSIYRRSFVRTAATVMTLNLKCYFENDLQMSTNLLTRLIVLQTKHDVINEENIQQIIG